MPRPPLLPSVLTSLILLIACALCPALAASTAVGGAGQEPPVATRLELRRLPDKNPAGQDLLAVLWLLPKPGWHAYSASPGQTGQPTRLAATLAPGDVALTTLYPPGHAIQDTLEPDKLVSVYEEPTPLFIPLADPGPAGELTAKLTLLACSDASCWPVRHTLRLPLAGTVAPPADAEPWWPLYQSLAAAGPADAPGQPAPESAGPGNDEAARAPQATTAPGAAGMAAGTKTAGQSPDAADDAAQAYDVSQAMRQAQGASWAVTPRYFQPALEVSRLWQAALFALLAGFILNFMPCVLPVISLKIFSMITSHRDMADAKRQHALFREKNLWFAVGVLLYFLTLSALFALTDLAWGQLFQKPRAVLAMTAVVFGLGLSLFGLWDLPIIDLKKDVSADRHPRLQSLFTGFLATLLATPCSGPFLGGVLGWALTQEPGVVAVVFACIGLGMASPFLLLALRPEWGRYFPRPGAWMVHFERVVGFILLGTCIYLLNILPSDQRIAALVLLLTVGFAAWMWGKWTDLRDSARNRWTIRLAALALVGVVYWQAGAPPPPPAQWRPFQAAEFRESLGRAPVLLDFTADWCPNCKLLERTVFTPTNLAAWSRRYGLRLIQADLTRDNPEALSLLRALGSQSIPVAAIFPAGPADPAGSSPLVLRDFFTTAQFEEALRQALGR